MNTTPYIPRISFESSRSRGGIFQFESEVDDGRASLKVHTKEQIFPSEAPLRYIISSVVSRTTGRRGSGSWTIPSHKKVVVAYPVVLHTVGDV